MRNNAYKASKNTADSQNDNADSSENNKNNNSGNDQTEYQDAVTILKQQSKSPGFVKHIQSETKYRKVAKFLTALGKEQASKILSHLDENEVQLIIKELVTIRHVPKEEAEELFKEFGYHANESKKRPQGGPEQAKKMLIQAFGEEAGEKYFNKAVPDHGYKPFDFLHEYDFQQVMMILRNESPQVITLILPYLKQKLAADILEAFHPDKQREIIKRMAHLKQVNPEVLNNIEESIKKKIRSQGKVVSQEIDGKGVLADILRNMEIDKETEILEEINKMNSELSEEIREKLYTIDSILLINDKEFENIIRDFTETELATILKGKADNIKEKFLSNVSDRRRMLIEEEYRHLGAVRRGDVNKSTRDFLEYLRKLEEDGDLIIRRNSDIIE